VIADGLTRNAVPPPLVGQCTLLQWQKLLDDLELAASSNSYSFACMCACLHPLSLIPLLGVFILGWLFPCVPLYLYYRIGGLKKALDRISTAFVEELPGLDVRIGSFMEGLAWPVPLDTYMNTREKTFSNGWLQEGNLQEGNSTSIREDGSSCNSWCGSASTPGDPPGPAPTPTTLPPSPRGSGSGS
jgi:hypothetical protein